MNTQSRQPALFLRRPRWLYCNAGLVNIQSGMIALIYSERNRIRLYAVSDRCKLRCDASEFVYDRSIRFQTEGREDRFSFEDDVAAVFRADDAVFINFLTCAVCMNFDPDLVHLFHQKRTISDICIRTQLRAHFYDLDFFALIGEAYRELTAYQTAAENYDSILDLVLFDARSAGFPVAFLDAGVRHRPLT